MRTLLLIIIVSLLAGCNSYMYKFSILEPANTETKPTPDDTSKPMFTYSDSLLNIAISISGHQGANGAKIEYLYDGISFSLLNKTDSVLILDWNKISFVDPSGNSGGSVMHENIRYTDCASMKSSSTIPPHGKITDIITPCSGVYFNSNPGGNAYWHVNILPWADEMKNIEFGFYMPISFGTMTKNYSFKFKAEPFLEK